MSDGVFRAPTVHASRVASRVALAACLAGSVLGASPRAQAQSADELKAARELFQEAYKDEQEKRFEAALDKFQRVARVRESAAVRYRIASVLESMNRLRAARDAFRALAASKPSLAANEQEIATSAADRANALDKRIPSLTLTLDGKPPADLKVSIDGAEVPTAALAGPQPLEPGEHVITASGTGVTPFESRVKLSEGGAVALTVPVGGRAGPVEPPPGGGPSAPSRGGDKTLAIVALGAGGVLLVTSAVLLAVREGDISDLDEACPGGACPSSRRTELESTRDQASTFGPLGITAGILGLGAAGLGVYLLARRDGGAPPAATGARTPARVAAPRLELVAAPLAGGGAMGVHGTF